MKIYYPKTHYDKDHRSMLFPLLKPFIKSEGFTDAQRIASYSVSDQDFVFAQDLENADIAVLTMAWNFYLKTNQQPRAIAFIKECAMRKKKVVTFNAGDFGVRIPFYENLIVLRPSGYKSKFTKNEYAIPAFIADPLKKYYASDKIFLRPYNVKPLIGFCGQANPSVLNAFKEILHTNLRNLISYIGLSAHEPQAILSTSFLRASVLKKLEQSVYVSTNFIYRKKYRAGVRSNKDLHQTTIDFYDNLKNSDYVVCVRGAGNFSIRLYETLAMGRIPIFINTDCSLPLENTIDWKKHMVWVEYSERNQVSEKVKAFHDSLSKADFIDLQLANRTLWKEQLTMGGFFKIFFNEI
ncbi:exostosin family protein [Aequorivita sp. SDUM287046]|uniref:Exostosin family protein n=1 Tax=Aequorivita aurantiaca TaxID=3053356 RepID=A0ABT8DIT3_9FLAO|nr:exostosin family protein [Aequorivita aurantiaca]MDN3725297.1 exostosin family protein [Aequorivita aurantiaca]